MALADLILAYVPFPDVPYYHTSYVQGKTPMSSTSTVITTLIGYLVLVFSIREVQRSRQPQKLNTLFRIHNVILSGGSALLLALMLEEIVPIVWNQGFYASICAESSWTPRLEFYYMINYYFKYLELLDTVFLALKKKPLAFLHVFHHSATALLCFTQLNGKTAISWVVIVLNLTVHVLMYYYYYAAAGGAKIWWKKYLTSMQITQFVIDLGVTYWGTYQHYAFAYAPSLPHVGDCFGSEGAALFGCGLLTSYLGLFIKFYIDTYKKPAAKGKANGNGKVSAVAKDEISSVAALS